MPLPLNCNVSVILNAPSSPTTPTANDHFAITFAPLTLAEVYRLADDSRNGAIVVMSGMVRDKPMNRWRWRCSNRLRHRYASSGRM